MEIKVKKAINGFVIETKEAADADGFVKENTAVFEFDETKHETEAFRSFVYDLAELLEVGGSRYDEKRFYAIVAPGDKHPEFNDSLLGKVIFGDK